MGDFAFADINQYIDRLNGKIILIRGNHDHHRSIKTAKFHEVYDLYTLKKTNPNIILCHYAMRVWERSHYDTWHLYGHTHNFIPSFQNSFDAGVDCHGYSPISFDDVEKIIKDQRHKIGE